MKTLSTLVELPEYQNFDCRSCGRCCAGYLTVALRPGEDERIRAQGWAQDPALQGETLVVRQGRGYRLAHRADGRCVFLDDGNRCRIHAKFGPEEKPLACRLYPFKFIPTGTSMRTDMRYDCPAMAGNVGRPVREYTEELTAMLPQLPAGAADPAPFLGSVRVGWGVLERITGTFARLIAHTELDLTQRVVACVQFSTILRKLNRQALDEVTLEQVLEAIFNTLIMAAAKDPLERIAPSQAALTGFRQLLVVYGREDRWGERVSLAQRYRNLFQMMGGKGAVPQLLPDFPAVDFAALEEPIGYPPDEVVEPLERSLRAHLESMGFFGPAFAGYGYLDGLNALLLTYPVTFWFARVYAAGKGLPAPDVECIRQAVSIVNHVHGLATVFNFPLERYHLRSLCNPVVLSKLCVWYGR